MNAQAWLIWRTWNVRVSIFAIFCFWILLFNFVHQGKSETDRLHSFFESEKGMPRYDSFQDLDIFGKHICYSLLLNSSFPSCVSGRPWQCQSWTALTGTTSSTDRSIPPSITAVSSSGGSSTRRARCRRKSWINEHTTVNHTREYKPCNVTKIPVTRKCHLLACTQWKEKLANLFLCLFYFGTWNGHTKWIIKTSCEQLQSEEKMRITTLEIHVYSKTTICLLQPACQEC